MGYATRSSSKDDSTNNGKNTEQTKKQKPEKNSSKESSCPDDDESEKSSDEEDEIPKTPTKKRTDFSEKYNSGAKTVSEVFSTQKDTASSDYEEEEETLSSTKKKTTFQTSASMNKEPSKSEETQPAVSKDSVRYVTQPSVRPKEVLISKKAYTKSTRDSCPLVWKTLIVELKTEDGPSVCIVSERWIQPAGKKYVLLYPTKHTPAKTEKAVREHEEPNDKYVEFEYLTRRICDSWAVARALLRKAIEQSDINTETDSARTSKRKRTPKIPYSPNQSSADGEDSDDKTDSAQGEKQKRKISNQVKKLKLTAKSQKPKKDECRELSPLRDFDDLSNSENGEETDVPLKKEMNKVQSTTIHSDQSYTNEEDEPLMEDISNQVEKVNKQKHAGATKKIYAPSGSKMPTLNNVLGSKNRQAVLTSFLPTAKKNNTLGQTSNKTPKPSEKDKDRCSTLAGSKIAHALTKTDTSTVKKSFNSNKTLQSLPKESDRGNTPPVSKIAHDSKKAATLTQGGSNSAKPKNDVPRKTQQVYSKEALAYKEIGAKSTRDKEKTSSSVCSNALVLRDSNNTKPGERLKSSMSSSTVMDFQSKPAATSQVKERFSENAQLAEGSKATSLSKVDKFIIQHLTGISKKNEQRFDSIDVKLDLILEQLLNGVRSVSLEEANVHIPVDSYEEWMDLEKVLANRDTAIALEKKISNEGGDTLGERVQRVWKTLITNKFGTQVSWVGHKGKPPVLNSEMFKVAVAAVCSHPVYAKADKKQIESHSKQWIWQSNKRHSRECQKAGDLNNNDSDMTRKRKQDEDDYEKKNESSDDEDDAGPLHNETLESID